MKGREGAPWQEVPPKSLGPAPGQPRPGPHIASAPDCARCPVPPSCDQAAGRAGAAALRQPSGQGSTLGVQGARGRGGAQSPRPHTRGLSAPLSGPCGFTVGDSARSSQDVAANRGTQFTVRGANSLEATPGLRHAGGVTGARCPEDVAEARALVRQRLPCAAVACRRSFGADGVHAGQG